MGDVHPRREDGTVDYSKIIPCRHCASDERIKHLLGVSSTDVSFDNFQLVKGTETSYKAAKAMVTLKTEWKLLLIYGTWGNGKTHLLESIANQLWKKHGILCRVQSMVEMMRLLKNTFDRKGKEEVGDSYKELMDTYCSTPYLIIDDVGSGDSNSPFSWTQLEDIILARYRDNLFTVITTNEDIKILPDFVRSRFSDAVKARMVLNSSPDYRPQTISSGTK